MSEYAPFAICPAHGWWAIYKIDRTDSAAERVAFWEATVSGWHAVVPDLDGTLIAAHKRYGEDVRVSMALHYDPAAYDDPASEPDHTWLR
jgi:hypothetical protein